MKVYNYNEEGVYTGFTNATQDPLESEKQGKFVALVPSNATLKEPLEAGENQVAQFQENTGNWQLVVYYSGKWYNKETQEETTFNIGDTPNINDYTQIEPPSSEHVFEDGAWVIKENIPQAIENKLAELERAYDDARANTFISYNGNQFGIKEKTIANFNALWAFGKKKEDDGSPLEGYPFTDKAGERVVMTKQQFSDLIDDAFEAIVELDTKEATMAHEINNLTSVEDIANYTITFS